MDHLSVPGLTDFEARYQVGEKFRFDHQTQRTNEFAAFGFLVVEEQLGKS